MPESSLSIGLGANGSWCRTGKIRILALLKLTFSVIHLFSASVRRVPASLHRGGKQPKEVGIHQPSEGISLMEDTRAAGAEALCAGPPKSNCLFIRGF